MPEIDANWNFDYPIIEEIELKDPTQTEDFKFFLRDLQTTMGYMVRNFGTARTDGDGTVDPPDMPDPMDPEYTDFENQFITGNARSNSAFSAKGLLLQSLQTEEIEITEVTFYSYTSFDYSFIAFLTDTSGQLTADAILLGNGTTPNGDNQPVVITPITPFVVPSEGYFGLCVIRTDGTGISPAVINFPVGNPVTRTHLRQVGNSIRSAHLVNSFVSGFTPARTAGIVQMIIKGRFEASM